MLGEKEIVIVMRMLLVLGSLILLSTVVDAQTASSKDGVLMSVGEDAHHAKLKLTTSIVDEHYCADGRLHYSLSFKFTNAGQQSVILDRFRPVVSGYMISGSERAASARKFQAHARTLLGLDEEGMDSQSNLDESRFIVLELGNSYEVTEKFSLSIKDHQGRRLRSGRHFLQVVVLTWYHPRTSNIEWREKWRQKGYLWSDSLSSDPMPFVVPNRLSVSDCD